MGRGFSRINADSDFNAVAVFLDFHHKDAKSAKKNQRNFAPFASLRLAVTKRGKIRGNPRLVTLFPTIRRRFT